MLGLFLLGLAFFVYVVGGYPLLLACMARRRTRPVAKRLTTFRPVSVLLPVRNGAPWLKAKLESIRRLNYPADRIEVIVVSDGSSDETEQIARSFPLASLRVIPIVHSGKAAALNRAMAAATGEILFFTDVRQRLDPDCLRELAACFADPQVGAVSGELIIHDGRTSEEASTGLYWKYEKFIRRRLSRLDSMLGATGAIYALRASLARPLPPDAILDDVELPLGAFFGGYRVVLEERARAYDDPASLDIEFRRKVRTLAGVYQTLRHVPALLGRTNRMRFHFFSHKLGRQLLPWALLLMLGSSFGLPAPWRGAALSMQGLLYGLALADLVIPERVPGKRHTAALRAFCVLMLAALCAVAILFVPRQVLWREARVPARTGAGSASA